MELSVKTLSNKDLTLLFEQKGLSPYNMILLDKVYKPVKSSWIFGGFREAATMNVALLELSYKVDAFDCDDYALFVMMLARLSNKGKGSIAVGFAATASHAFNFAVVEKNDLIFFEPQNFVKMSFVKPDSIVTLIA